MLSSSLLNTLHTTSKHIEKLDKWGLITVQDLLEFFPRALDSLELVSEFSQINLGQKNTLVGELYNVRSEKTKHGKTLFKAGIVLHDDAELEVIWFRKPYNLKPFEGFKKVYLVGKIDQKYGTYQISNPELHWNENVHVGAVRPIYPESPPITSKWLREKIKPLLSLSKEFPQIIPPNFVEKYKLMPPSEALQKIHFPTSEEEWRKAKETLGFQEVFLMQLQVMQAKFLRQKKQTNNHSLGMDIEATKEDLAKLPFELTFAQKKSLYEILQDYDKDRPMSRLLQGDVGAGKTIVAFLAAMPLYRAGFQTVILAPTEILAKQHYESFFKIGLVDDFSHIAFLAGSTTKKNKEIIKNKLANGEIKILIGTHAVLTDDTIFQNLGLAIIDEQHRFGVEQRAKLTQGNTHLLSMTATPIPRSLALTVYGDQDISIIDQKPSGRKPPITKVIGDDRFRRKTELFIEDQVKKGFQIFWVCPLVEASENMEARDVKAEYERISSVFPDLRVDFLHGKMRPKEKEAIMTRFKNHEFDILVSTSVIEVGVDIPNATVMVIENSERFGLAQLHQFRGRIGRNDKTCYCFLMVGKKTDKYKDRLKAMERSHDGFYLSEVDLELRGAGDLYGLKQSGLPDLKCAELSDTELIMKAREAAEEILNQDVMLFHFPNIRKAMERAKVYFE